MFNKPFGAPFGDNAGGFGTTSTSEQNVGTSTSSGGIFGTSNVTSNSFTSGLHFGLPPFTIVPAGTTIRFNPPVGNDIMVKHGCTKNIKTVHHCITAMYEYENKSLEELRLEDYQVNRKGPWFGLSTATPSTVTGLFGSSTINTGAQNKTGFGTSFGTGSLFGQTMQISGLVFKPFGQDAAVQNTGFSSGNISIPGQLNTNTLANEGPVQNLYDEATCPICLEYFKKPVSVDCVHIFCRACITRCWKKSDTDASCPQCREPCQQRNLRPI